MERTHHNFKSSKAVSTEVRFGTMVGDGVLGSFSFNKHSGLKFQKFHVPSGTIHWCWTDLTKPSSFGYCSCEQDAKERYWGSDNNFVK